jgi:hypothetical protein
MITGDTPATVYPGDDIDHPHPLAGFEPVEADPDEKPQPVAHRDNAEEVTE